MDKPATSSKRTWPIPLTLSLLVMGVSIITYLPVLQYSFFWEDPFDIGQVQGYSYWQLFGIPNSNSYYRPLTLVLMKLLSGSGPAHAAWPFHLVNAGAHCLAALVLFGVIHYLLRNVKIAFATAILFSLYPPAFEATSRAISPHSIVVLLTLVILWLYAVWRESGGVVRLILALVLTTAAMFIQENAILIPALLISLELFLVIEKRVSRFSLYVFAFLIPAILFVGIWFSIPKPAGEFSIGLHLKEALYLSQGLSYPYARLISMVGGLGMSTDLQAIVALFTTLVTIVVTTTRVARPTLLLALIWWLIASSLAWFARTMSYLEVSPRVMYFPSFAAALVWAVMLAGRTFPRVNLRFIVRLAIVLLVAIQSVLTLSQVITLYAHGSRLMDEIVATGQQGGRQLYINVPDRVEYRQPLYPLGYWGMLLAPVSQDLSEFVGFASGVKMQTVSLSDFELSKADIDASSYRVNSRGVNAHASDKLYEAMLWADRVLWTDYKANGRMAILTVGDIDAAHQSGQNLGSIGDIADVISATIEPLYDQLIARITLISRHVARPTDTIFVHVLDSSGKLVAQKDGDSLNGLVPPSAWRTGNTVTDVRIIPLTSPLPSGEYRVMMGMYNRVDGIRYPVRDNKGTEYSGGELEIARFSMP